MYIFFYVEYSMFEIIFFQTLYEKSPKFSRENAQRLRIA